MYSNCNIERIGMVTWQKRFGKNTSTTKKQCKPLAPCLPVKAHSTTAICCSSSSLRLLMSPKKLMVRLFEIDGQNCVR